MGFQRVYRNCVGLCLACKVRMVGVSRRPIRLVIRTCFQTSSVKDKMVPATRMMTAMMQERERCGQKIMLDIIDSTPKSASPWPPSQTHRQVQDQQHFSWVVVCSLRAPSFDYCVSHHHTVPVLHQVELLGNKIPNQQEGPHEILRVTSRNTAMEGLHTQANHHRLGLKFLRTFYVS